MGGLLQVEVEKGQEMCFNVLNAVLISSKGPGLQSNAKVSCLGGDTVHIFPSLKS